MKTLLALLSLVLALLFVAELWWYLGRDRQLVPLPPRAVVSAGRQTVLPPKAAFKLPDEANYEEILERPLFVEGRRPPSDEPQAVETAPAPQDLPPPKLSLVGVYTTPKGTTALVRNEVTRDTLRVRLGDLFEGWEVSEIEAQRLVLKKQGDEQVFELRDYEQTGAAAEKDDSAQGPGPHAGARTPASAGPHPQKVSGPRTHE